MLNTPDLPLQPDQGAPPLPDHERMFSGFYERGEWGSDRINGSLMETTRVYRAFIKRFIAEHDIHSVLDAGCGKWGFADAIDWKGARCLGLDVARCVIDRNRQRIPHVASEQADLRNLGAYTGVKDMLHHWSLHSVRNFLAQPALASCRYLLLANCDDEARVNRDIAEGDWRPLNLLAGDFNLPGARAVLRYGTKRIVHLGPRLGAKDLFQRFEWWIVNPERRADRLAHARRR